MKVQSPTDWGGILHDDLVTRRPQSSVRVLRGLSGMRLLTCLLSLCSIVLAVAVVCATASVVSEYLPQQLDWEFLLPIVAPLFVVAIAIVILFIRTKAPLLLGCLWGIFAGANLLLIHQALRLIFQNELISTDGTAYWALLCLPAFYGGLAAIVLGGILGIWAGLIVKRRTPSGAERSYEQGPAFNGPSSPVN